MVYYKLENVLRLALILKVNSRNMFGAGWIFSLGNRIHLDYPSSPLSCLGLIPDSAPDASVVAQVVEFYWD